MKYREKENFLTDTDVNSDESHQETNSNLIIRVLLIAALLISFPLYLLVLFFLGDPALVGGYTSFQPTIHESEPLKIKRTGGMNFSPMQLTQITSNDELLKSLVLTVEFKSGIPPTQIYLRRGSFERFTASGMESRRADLPGKEWPDFAPDQISSRQQVWLKTAYILFFTNFEEFLPHPAALNRLAGPLDFCCRQDGSIALDKTIATGDEFEIEFIDVPRLVDTDIIPEVATDSPYTALGFMENTELKEKAAAIIAGTVATSAMIMRFVDYLETSGVYKTDYQQTTQLHPVKEFLLHSTKGHCQHFAAALVVLCRLQGIPARVAGGFSSNRFKDGRFIVIEGMAHAWAEILTEEGWKVVDPAPRRSETPPLIAADLSLPDAEQLRTLNQEQIRQNARKHNQSGDTTPPRQAQQKLPAKSFQESPPPGSLIKDPARAEQYQRDQEERQKFKAEEQSSRNFQNTGRKSIAFLLIILIIWALRKKAEKLLRALLKLLKGKEAEESQEASRNQAKITSILENIHNKSITELTGDDLIALFHSFTQLMGEKGQLPRYEHETPSEYFERLCVVTNIRLSEGQKAASFFEAELYGQRKTGPDDLQQFMGFLQQILVKVAILKTLP